MRYEVEAVAEVNRRVGDRVFNNQPGDKLELSGADVEVALSPMMDGAYKLAREIPETDEEKARAGAAAAKAELMSQPKEKLVKQAEKLDIAEADSMLKAPLAAAIVETKLGKSTDMETPGISRITESKNAKSTARSKGDKQ